MAPEGAVELTLEVCAGVDEPCDDYHHPPLGMECSLVRADDGRAHERGKVGRGAGGPLAERLGADAAYRQSRCTARCAPCGECPPDNARRQWAPVLLNATTAPLPVTAYP